MTLPPIGMNVGHFEETWRDTDLKAVMKLLAMFPVVRFMDWQRTNASPVVDRLPDEASYKAFIEGRNAGIGTWKDEDGNWLFQGMPIERIIEISYLTNTRPWVNIPHQATDELMAHIVAEFIEKTDRPIFEFSNEIWNTHPEFSQHVYAAEAGRKLLTQSVKDWAKDLYFDKQPDMMFALTFQAERTKRLAQLVRKHGKGKASVVVGSQMYNPRVSDFLLRQCGDVVDAVAVAPYIGGLAMDFNKRLHELARNASSRLAEIAETPTEEAFSPINHNLSHEEVVASYKQRNAFISQFNKTLLETDEAETWAHYSQILMEEVDGRFTDCFIETKELASRHGCRVWGYEAGLHLVGDHYRGYARSENAGIVTRNLLEKWHELGGDLICLYSLASSYHTNHFWGHVEIQNGEYMMTPRLTNVLV